MMRARYIAFVAHHNVNTWLLLGWLCRGPLPGIHGYWSCGVEWLCDCPVRWPRNPNSPSRNNHPS